MHQPIHVSATSTDANETRHVVFIGDTGSGKSSVINLIATSSTTPSGPARVTSDAAPCTIDFASYDVTIDGNAYTLWDTPGLNQPSRFMGLFRRASKGAGGTSLQHFLRERRRRGELDLVVFCLRGTGRVQAGTCSTYNRFCRPARKKGAIPVAVAVTHLEKQQPTMDVWWENNARTLGKYGLEFDGHACVTGLSSNHRRWASQQEIFGLISDACRRRSQSMSDPDVEFSNDPGKSCVVC